MTAREIIKQSLDHKGTAVTPYTAAFEQDIHKRLGEYYGDSGWEQKKLRQFMCCHLYADTVRMRQIDDVYSTDGYGALWRMDRVPWHLEKPPLPEPKINGAAFPKADDFVAGIKEQKKSAIAAFEADGEHYRMISMGWGIFEHSWRMRGFENALTDMHLEEKFYAELTERLTDIFIEMLKACEDVPADAVLFGDDWGDQRGVIMGAQRWRKFLKPCWKRIYAETHRQGKKTLQHSCGGISEIYGDLIEIGLDCHESAQPEPAGMATEQIKKRWGGELSFWGCLGSQSVLHDKSPEEIKKAVFFLRDLFRNDGGFILAPAKPLFNETPIEKAAAFVEALTEINL
ncbi:MAG: uroporphyrinogen decarboxylase family protein [Defluviitaleaceae bacterium]|nr:uroporphyrinogen decarboxylase family protein [Defluviitaleaceae bacterium]